MNILQPPPASLTVGRNTYEIDTDYRTWLKVNELIESIDLSVDDDETFYDNMDTVDRLQTLVFGKILDEDFLDIQNAVVTFIQGYPRQHAEGPSAASNDAGGQGYSFLHDINYIILAIRNQSGIDLSFNRKEPYHWWLFLLEFQTLEEHHLISRIITYRLYEGDDPEMLKHKAYWALPEKMSNSQQRDIDELEAMLYES